MTIYLPALVTIATVVLLMVSITMVAMARSRHRIPAPATTGPVEFERVFRTQANTFEAAVMFLPALWVSATYWNPTWSGYLGIVWILARVLYMLTYARGRSRSAGFFVAAFVNLALVVTGTIGVVDAMMRVG